MSQINVLSLSLKKLEREEQFNPIPKKKENNQDQSRNKLNKRWKTIEKK
jgi:hypothetical protein